tara:strand:+ start:91076 stop:91765 length:690 start_codon:yes stop_codon:yes gene_type:complete
MTPHIFGLNPTKTLPDPTYYAEALNGEFRNWAFCEERSQEFKGRWREEVFEVSKDHPMDLEIGTGNGFHFAHYAKAHPERCFIGLEIKYKPLIQSIRRAINEGSTNMRIGRFHASYLDEIFDEGELNHVIIHHPDPWPKKKQWKRRLIQDDFLEGLHRLQRPGSRVDFKTDDLPYFEWALEKFKNSKYGQLEYTFDLHNSQFASENFETHFEKIFLKKEQPIYFLRVFS